MCISTICSGNGYLYRNPDADDGVNAIKGAHRSPVNGSDPGSAASGPAPCMIGSQPVARTTRCTKNIFPWLCERGRGLGGKPLDEATREELHTRPDKHDTLDIKTPRVRFAPALLHALWSADALS